ncbi:PcfJ domain-containing protein [Desulfopila aestuarii]|uniref:Uncharacterized protein n=1 Tax=Desulfopila aestuarii DSM 18488 TaxID=1121416 RepID=A0A1M7Y998_9BACT|nr:PcfJ domain-containing protein [Desulfopila aestuarii]SHO49212.1 hypothetical protein SAMN02745220_02734 [Desulfopila aestuarii DSM 18488]
MLSQLIVDELNTLLTGELSGANTSKRSPRWACKLSKRIIGEYVVNPLTSARMIKSEGYLMQNCVRQYIHLCKSGDYLLFSIQNLPGEKVATLGVRKHDNRWYFDDCLGKNNTYVIETTIEPLGADHLVVHEMEYTEIFSVAHEVVRLLNCEYTVL